MKTSTLGLLLVVTGTVCLPVLACSSSASDDLGKTELPVTTGHPIVSAIGGKCLDDRGDGTANFNKIQLWQCNGTAAQAWAYENGTLVGPGGKCLDIHDDAQTPGTVVDLHACNGTKAQEWTLAGTEIKTTSGLCLDVRGGADANGTQVQVWGCNGTSSQVWHVSGVGSGSGSGTGRGTGSGSGSGAGRGTGNGTGTGSGSGMGMGTGTGTGTTSGVWVYRNGEFNWPPSNDYSYAVTSVSYTDSSGTPLSGAKDVRVVSQPWGGWQPAAGIPLTPINWDQNIAGMGHFTFALKPTVAGQSWKLFFHKVGDVLVFDASGQGETVMVNSGSYGPTSPPANEWSTYVVPLADVLTDWSAGGVPGAGPPVLLTNVYKFAIADNTGVDATWFVDDVGFIP